MKFKKETYEKYSNIYNDDGSNIRVRSFKLVKVRKRHKCHMSLIDQKCHDILKGEYAVVESGIYENEWYNIYTCTKCLDKYFIDDVQLNPDKDYSYLEDKIFTIIHNDIAFEAKVALIEFDIGITCISTLLNKNCLCLNKSKPMIEFNEYNKYFYYIVNSIENGIFNTNEYTQFDNNMRNVSNSGMIISTQQDVDKSCPFNQ